MLVSNGGQAAQRSKDHCAQVSVSVPELTIKALAIFPCVESINSFANSSPLEQLKNSEWQYDTSSI